jgi:hypothetical protein
MIFSEKINSIAYHFKNVHYIQCSTVPKRDPLFFVNEFQNSQKNDEGIEEV